MSGVVTRSKARPFARKRDLCAPIGPDALPMEMLTHVLTHLPIPSLRRASGISRRFYASAWDAGLYIDRKITWGQPRTCDNQILAFQELVEHALPKGLNLKLTVFFWPSLLNYASDRIPDDIFNRQMRDILSSITSALSLFVSLSIHLMNFDDNIAAALGHPAPRLRKFELSRSTSQGCYGNDLSPSLFAGHAPVLRKMELSFIGLTAPIPALQNVTFLRLYCTEIPRISLASHFSRLSALELDVATGGIPTGFYVGTSLRSLLLSGGGLALQDVRYDVNIAKIPDVYLDCDEIKWVEPDFDNAAEFSLRLTSNHVRDDVDVSVIVVPSHRLWRRTYAVLDWAEGSTLTITDKPGATTHLTYLRVDSAHLHSFLSCNVAFPALRTIKIDLFSWNRNPATIWPPDALRPPDGVTFDTEDKSFRAFHKKSFYLVPCGVLEEVTLFALNETITVQSREAAFLARALGQHSRPKREKTALVLVGIELAKPVAQSLLDETFSTVRRCGFSGRRSKEDYDDGLWETVV